jgi:hypothetical protein
VSGRKASEPEFDVWPTRTGAEDLKGLKGAQKKAAQEARAELERSGCAAAHYRLSGAAVERICVMKLRDNWRMLILFPASSEVAILLVGPHERENPDLDVYRRLYALLGVSVPDDEHRKPACCDDDGQAPVDPDLVDEITDRTRDLAREERRSRRRGE